MRTERSRAVAVSIAFLVSGLTSYITLVACKRALTPDDFGRFSIFWSLGFFIASVSAAPAEQELSRSIAVQLERHRSAREDLRVATNSMSVSVVALLAVATVLLLSGVAGDIGTGVTVAIVFLVAGEAAAAIVRGETAARRDTRSLVAVVAGHGMLRAVAAVGLGAATGNLVAACAGVAVGGMVPAAFVPMVWRRRDDAPAPVDPVVIEEFSRRGMWGLVIATPPRALFAIGTPVLAAIVAGSDDTALVGDVLAALSLTSAPVLVAAALQATLLPQFASWAERDDLARIRSTTTKMITFLLAMSCAAALLAYAVGVEALELLFGATPGIDAGSLAAMTGGAGLLFLANLLVPACIAIRNYSIVTVAWTVGAVGLVVAALAPGNLAFVIGRAVLAGAALVVIVLVWGLRTLWARAHSSSSAVRPPQRADTGG